MVADGARALAVPLPGGTPRPEVNSRKQEMDTPFFSPLFGGITNTPPTVDSPQFYSSWSPCGDDANAIASLHDFTQKRTQVNLSYSGSGPDMFGLVTSILEEPNKQEPVTDWNSLSRLFPPVWSSDFENTENFSGLFPTKCLENEDLTNLVGTQNTYEESLQKSSSAELLNREFEDFRITRSWLATSDLCSQSPGEILKNANLENKAFKSNGINQQGGFAYQNVPNYDKNQLNSSGGKSHNDFSTFSSCTRIKDSTYTSKEHQKADKARGLLGKNDTEGSSEYLSQLSNSPADGIWDPVIQGNNLPPKRYTSFTATHDSQQFSCSSPYFLIPTLNQENGFPKGMNIKLQEDYPQNNHSSISTKVNVGNAECKIPIHHQKGSCNHLPLKPALQNMNSSYNGYTWLDNKILSPVATSHVTNGKQKKMSPQLSSGCSTPSSASSTNQSVAQPSYSQVLPVLSSRKDGKLHISANIPNRSGFSNCKENHKQHNSTGHSQNDSLATIEGYCGKESINASSSWLSQQHSVNESAKHSSLHNKQSQYSTGERTGQNERRCKNNWIPHPGYVSPNQAQLDILRRKEQNGGNLSDFINPSFLPLFPLMSGYKHMPNFLPFNPHPFSSPTNVAFSPLPFPLSELADLLHYDDFPYLNPFFNELVCGDIAAQYFAFPPPLHHYRPPKNRTGPANELHSHLEECYEQWRALERERKKAEADLARNFPGKRVSSSNNAPFSRLPAKPSRVDRLIVDQFREQARVHTLVGKMERLCGTPVHGNISATLRHHLEAICATRARRKDEIVNAVNPQRQGTSRYNNERDVLALAAAIKDLAFFTRKARTALWCALQMTLAKTSVNAPVKKEEVERALQELCPVNGNSQVKTSMEHEDKENKRENHEQPQQVIK
ncbi:meiosis-specific coiled-coil domain-containing protein MEIOC-like isoform X2 [Rhineura floridana]|uniref:meiosis-specific coiled-coil domain-containing protein MEIOC-like isoform X2 n=1 Tax=Rhineura floridana TaxID=261503 RepID=UPI002AC82DE7|nr:meiosis-specific coiled-coil domain-containing protein MEIOC-like isoform X2 [Rhineura floridana]